MLFSGDIEEKYVIHYFLQCRCRYYKFSCINSAREKTRKNFHFYICTPTLQGATRELDFYINLPSMPFRKINGFEASFVTKWRERRKIYCAMGYKIISRGKKEGRAGNEGTVMRSRNFVEI